MTDPLPTSAAPPIPPNESERLAALYRYQILDTPPEAAFDRITALAARLFQMPVVLISLVDKSRAWFKSCVGFEAREVPRDATICSFAVLLDEPLIVPDTRLDERLACNPFVQSEPGVRFYAGAPLLSHDGFNLGTLCLLDSQPHESFTAEQQTTLQDLAAMVVDELELRLAAQQIAQMDAALREITRGVATVTGQAFLEALVQHFARVLHVDYVYIGVLEEGNPKRLNTIATCAHGQIVDNLNYLLQDTPCWEVIEQRKMCCYPHNVQAHFPNAPLLKPLAVESYVAAPVFDSNGAPLGLLGVMDGKPLDNVHLAESLLTLFADRIATELERQQTEAALRESEQQNRVILESIADGFLALDQHWRFTYANRAAERLVARSAKDLLGQNFWEEFPGLEGSEFAVMYRRVMQERIAASYTGFYPDHNRWYEVNSYPAADGITVYFRDVTDRRQSELEREALLARERQYLNQLQGLSHAALAINSSRSLDAVLQVITQQAAAIIGAHQSVTSMTIDQNWAQAINAVHLSDKYALWRDYHELPDGSGIYACVCHANRPMRMTQAELEAHLRWKGFGNAADQHPPMRGWLAAPLIGRDGQNIGLIQLSDKYEGEFTETDESILVQLAQMAAVAVENTRLYDAERQARALAETAKEEAQAANRIKDEFLAVLSHELRSPLNPILGWTRLLQRGKLDSARQAEALSIIERNAKLQTQLIEDLLDISRIMRGKLSLTVAPVSLTFVITAAAETVRLAAEAKSIQIALNLAEVPPIAGDAARLQQVVWNLLSNAVKFTPAGGRVEVGLEEVGLEEVGSREPRIENRNDSYAQLTVTDTGKGIHPEFLPYVFEYFRQEDGSTTRQFGGLGLGLAIVRQIVELHGGTIHADSPGERLGATFTVRLPLMAAPPAVVLSPPASHPTLSLQGVRILLVDDDADTREFLKVLLEQAGATVAATASAEAALTALIRSQPDLLLSDIGMPDKDGYMLMQQVRALPAEQGGTVPAIALTAYAGEFDQRRALSVGFQQHLAKPVDPDRLIRTIGALLAAIPT